MAMMSMFDWLAEDPPTWAWNAPGHVSLRQQAIGRQYRKAVEAFIASSSRPHVSFEEFHGGILLGQRADNEV